MANLVLPGNPRYQPQELIPFFGYDNIYKFVADVEIATLETLAEIGAIPEADMNSFTPEDRQMLRAITTTEVDERERKVTKHDIRAWVQIAQSKLDLKIARWVHVPLTSYDALDTARVLQFKQAYVNVTQPKILAVLKEFVDMVEESTDRVQIGRTHGQHALPITVGFWLANILQRLYYNAQQMHAKVDQLRGKISGAVGAYNAQVGLGFHQSSQAFESMVLERLKLEAAPISSQILPPEPFAYYLHSCCMMSASLAQFGRDCRHLMRTEIGEVTEGFGAHQVGSSTMAHKRNPINFENLEGMWLRTKGEYGKVFDTLISEHQRDLVGSSLYRDFSIIVINLHVQLNTLLRKDEKGQSFLSRIQIGNLAANFDRSKHLVLAEPLYIALQMAGYPGDAHELVNRKLVPTAQITNESLMIELERLAQTDPDIRLAFENIPESVKELFASPENYTGLAKRKALEISSEVRKYLQQYS